MGSTIILKTFKILNVSVRLWKFKENRLLHFSHSCCSPYYNRNVLQLKERGMLHNIFPERPIKEIVDLLNSKPQCVYSGFDPTADSLHVGNLLIIMNLLHWLRGGHNVIALVGGATAQIGDPSGKSKEREKLGINSIQDNSVAIQENIKQIFKNHNDLFLNDSSEKHKGKYRILNNLSWYSDLNAVDFVNSIGRSFRVGDMISRHSIKSRMESGIGINFTEFCYQIFQAYDWFHLLQKYDCRFQIGGSDQMGNIVSGYELISKFTDVSVCGITIPLITSEEGDKYGKSAGNAVWLSSKKTTPFHLYQFFFRTKDSEVEKLLALFTFDTLGEIKDTMIRHKAQPEERFAQKRLAEQVILLVHGEEGLASALKSTEAMYSKNIDTLARLSSEDMLDIFRDSPIVEALLEPGTTILKAALKSKCFIEEKDAVRIISAGGFYINHLKTTNFNEVLAPGIHILPNQISLLRVGKKNYSLIKWIM